MGIEKMEELDLIFGSDSKGSTPEERARSSSRVFVRGQVQLAEDSPEATGRRYSAWEALQTFGISKLHEITNYGSAIILGNAGEPANTLKTRRNDLGLSIQDVSRNTGLTEADITDAENPETLSSIHVIEKIAQALALDEHAISFSPHAGADPELAARLKAIAPVFTPSVVSKLSEAAWVSRKQYELFQWLHSEAPATLAALGFEPDSIYGDSHYPAWQHGYYLAKKTREIIGIKQEKPIESLRKLIEEQLMLPLIQIELPNSVAGATIANGPARGIAINIQGANRNVWVRRMTLAHELGHLLWDPDEKLKHLEVDNYSDIDKAEWTGKFIEQRANAFAIEFLAPQDSVIELFQSADDNSRGLQLVMETFGISYTSACFHIKNALSERNDLDELTLENVNHTDEWAAREDFTNDYFRPERVPISRRGRFACMVVEANDTNLLSDDTAASFLKCSLDDYLGSVETIRSICGMTD